MILIGFDFTEKKLTHEEEHDKACALRDALFSYATADTEGLVYAVREGGKPYVVGQDYTFSVSHTSGCIACAISVPDTVSDAEVLPETVTTSGIYSLAADYPCETGLDVEMIDAARTNDRVEAIAKRYYSPAEKEKLSLADDKTTEFYRIWTAKESCVKCTGLGIKAITATDTEEDMSGRIILRFAAVYGDKRFAAAVCLMKTE